MTDITSVLPHRYPFLFVDRITEIKPGDYVRGYKNITYNEYFFNGHFPNNPILPGVIIIEAMTQIAKFATYEEGNDDNLGMIVSIKEVQFKKPVVPGDKLELFFKVNSHRGKYLNGSAEASVNGKTVATISEALIYIKPNR